MLLCKIVFSQLNYTEYDGYDVSKKACNFFLYVFPSDHVGCITKKQRGLSLFQHLIKAVSSRKSDLTSSPVRQLIWEEDYSTVQTLSGQSLIVYFKSLTLKSSAKHEEKIFCPTPAQWHTLSML